MHHHLLNIRLIKRNACLHKFSRCWLALAVCVCVVLLVISLTPTNSVYKDLSKHKYRNRLTNNHNRQASDYNNHENFLVSKNTTHPKSEPNNFCDVIHIGIVCSGYRSNLFVYTLLKSIYFYRVNPIHFHIIVNKASRQVLQTLFDTWSVPQVEVTFYDINDHILDVRWVPNSHYSGLYGLLKLVFPKIVPLEVTNRLIVLDTDLIVVSDILELWNMFQDFDDRQALGIVENESPYYLGKLVKERTWPAIGKGFNSGVLLYNLERLKRLDWPKVWASITKQIAIEYGATGLGDQDVINAVLVQRPEILYQVPCYWNTQFSFSTTSYDCYNKHKVKIIHWNSPKKTTVENRDGDYFRTIQTSFAEQNGNLLKRQLYYCENSLRSNNTKAKSDLCSEFHLPQTRRTLLFFKEYDYVPHQFDVTFTAQLSYDRLRSFEELVKNWEGPISVAFYVTDPELQLCIQFIESSEFLQERTNIAYHAVFKDNGVSHPINLLRNVALNNVNTPFVFLADIDFLPTKDLYNTLKFYLGSIKEVNSKVLIVPAFETQRYRSKVPKNKQELVKMWDKGDLFPFRFDVWEPGHAPTDYKQYRTAVAPYQVKWQRDYEPYVVVRSDVTAYDIRFMGFGWNKVSHVMELEAQGYEFTVLPNAFIIHKPHAPSYDIAKFRSSPIYRMCIQDLKEQFVQELYRKYGRVFDQKDYAASAVEPADNHQIIPH